MIKMSLIETARKLGYSLPSTDASFQGISIDTRTIKPGNLFVAVKGEKLDGHDFISEAVKKGAIAVLVNKTMDISLPQLVVNDTLDAFGKIAALWRNQFSIPIIGVTGSNGKTTLKNMIAGILRAASNDESVLATEGNLNNNIGVPIMLCRLTAEHRFAVLEMGMNHAGEISYLTHLVKPQVAVVNNAAEAHLEGLKNVAGVARAKGEIFQGLAVNGTAVLNGDDNHFDYWRSLVTQFKKITFGLDHPADVTATINEKSITLKTHQGEIDVTLPLLGKHNVMNALAATAATLAIGIDLNAIKTGLENVSCAPGRMRQYILASGTRVIDDTYNANPFSLQAAVNTIASLSGTKLVVLGDMKELGANAKEMHFTAGEKIRAAGIHHLFTLGEMSAATAEGFGQSAQHFTDQTQLITALHPHLKDSTTILIKGSRSMKMEKIVEAIIPAEELEQLH